MSRRRKGLAATLAAVVTGVGLFIATRPVTQVKPLGLCSSRLVTILIGPTRFCTHGGDPEDAIAQSSTLCLPVVGCPKPSTPAPTPHTFVCATPGAKAVQLIYAHPSDRPDLYDKWRPTIISIAARMDDALASRNIRWVCSGGQPTVERITVTAVGSDGVFSFSDYLKTVSPSHTSSSRDYLGFVSDVEQEYPYGGQATIDDDDDPTGNANDVGPAYSMVDHLSWTGALHELGHNLGAVQCSAPHSSCDGRKGHHHCTDENDIMCYDDGTTQAMTRPCDVPTPLWDCGMNDYFNPAPSKGTYLDVRWNLARSAFLTAT